MYEKERNGGERKKIALFFLGGVGGGDGRRLGTGAKSQGGTNAFGESRIY